MSLSVCDEDENEISPESEGGSRPHILKSSALIENDHVVSKARSARSSTAPSLMDAMSMSASSASLEMSSVLPPLRFAMFGKCYKIPNVTMHDSDVGTSQWRRLPLDMVNANPREMQSKLMNTSAGFPRTVQTVKNDSNRSGGVVLKIELREAVEFVSAIGILPKYGIIKLCQYRLNNKTGKGRLTGSENVLNASEPCNVEAELMRKFRTLILNDITPCLPLLYMFTVVNDWQNLNNIENNIFVNRDQVSGKETKWLEELQHGKIRSQAMCIFMEHVRGGSLRGNARSKPLTPLQWSVVLFQVFYTLAVLDDVCKFRHNDLHLGNIALHTRKPKSTQCFNWHFKGVDHWLPNVGFEARIIDFDWSTCEGIVNSKVSFALHKSMPVATHHDPAVFDTHRLLLAVYLYVGTPKQIKNGIKAIYSNVSSSNFLTSENTKHVNNFKLKRTCTCLSSLPTPHDVLRSKLFQQFRTKPVKKSVVPPVFTFLGK
jgi:hypothetical protein